MSAESPTLPSIAVSPLADGVRLYRRICLLRAMGETVEAAQIESTELADALEAVRVSGDSTALAPLFAAEETRVADAQLLAEILAPLLASRLAALRLQDAAANARRSPSHRPPRPEHAAPAVTPSVADFIEGMLAQDRAAPHSD